MTALDDRAIRGVRALVGEPGPGELIAGRFELREIIGEGGMGVVYAALDRERGREVAVKIVRCADADASERFSREAGALATIAHVAVVPYVAHGTHAGWHWVAMDRLAGTSLAARLARGPLSVGDTIALGRCIASGLAAAHRASIIHRDVKPSNVFLVDVDPSRARLLDFGVARDDAAPTLTAKGALVGTPGYMAPEQARGMRASPASDVFALGCVLFECVAGRAAFSGETTETLVAQILLEAPPLLREVRSEVPLALEGLVEQMLDKEPGKRPSADDVARELRELGSHVPTEPSAEGDPPLAEGTVIGGKYRIERRIGEGGMGIVVAARHLQLGKRVALKLLRPDQSADEARFLREAQAASRIESEHVARVLDVGRTESGAPYIVMEHLSGVDLARRLVDGGAIAVHVAVRYVLEACTAIAEAHALGIVHRDIKPSNLFLVSRRDGTEMLKVLDFGISKVSKSFDGGSAATSMTGASTVIGSVAYMSPEQLQGSKYVDARTDVWSLGVVLHELVAASRPFEGASAAALGARIAAAPPVRLRDVAPHAPHGLEAVIRRCLEKDPEKRIGDVRALAAALAPFAAPAQIARAASPRLRRHALVAAGAGALLVAASVLAMRAFEPKAIAPPAASASSVVLAPATAVAPPAMPLEAESATSSVASASPPKSIAVASAPRPVVARPIGSPAPPTPKRPAPDLDLRDPALQAR